MQPRLPDISLPNVSGSQDQWSRPRRRPDISPPKFPTFGTQSSGNSQIDAYARIAAQEVFSQPSKRRGPMPDEAIKKIDPMQEDPNIWTKGFQTLGKGFNWIDENIAKPTAALGLAGFGGLTGGPDFTPLQHIDGEQERLQKTNSIVSQILNGSMSVGQAWDDLAEIQSERPFALQLGSEILFDPLNLIPGAVFAKPITGGLKAIRGGVRATRMLGDTATARVTELTQLPDPTTMLNAIHDPAVREKLSKVIGANHIVKFFNPNAVADMDDPAERFIALKMIYDETIDNATRLELGKLFDFSRKENPWQFNENMSLTNVFRKVIGGRASRIPARPDRLREVLPGLFQQAVEAQYRLQSPLDQQRVISAGRMPSRGEAFDLGKIADTAFFKEQAAYAGVDSRALRRYMELARIQVIRDLHQRPGEPLKLSEIREMLRNPAIQRSVYHILATPRGAGSETIQRAMDSAITAATKRETRRPVRESIYFNEVAQNPELFDLTPIQQQFLDESNDLLVKMKNYVISELGPDAVNNEVFKEVPGKYFPNLWKMFDDMGYLKETGDPVIFGGIKGYENSRLYDYATDAIDAGLRPYDMRQALETTVKGMYQQVAEAKLAQTVGVWNGTAAKRIKQGYRLDVEDIVKVETLEPAIKKKIVDFMSNDSNKWLAGMSEVSSAMRTMQSAFDLGAPLIHGLPVLLTNPAAWSKAVGVSLAAMFDESVMGRFVSEHLDSLQKLNMHNQLHGSGIDMIESIGRGGLIRRGLEKAAGRREMRTGLAEAGGIVRRSVRVAGKGGVAGTSAIERQFESFLVASKALLWESLEPMALSKLSKDAAKKGIVAGTDGFNKLQQEIMSDLASHVAKMTGTVSMANLGLRQNRRKLLSGLIMYAPRYRMAAYGLMADVVRGGLRGELARTRLSKMAMSGLMFYSFIAYKLGNEPQLNPAEPGFMEIKIGNEKIGIGSAWLSTVRLLTNVTEQVNDDPNSIYKLTNRDNALNRFMRGQVSPLSGLGIDLATGRNYIGEPMPENYISLGTATEMIGNYAAPFWLSSALEHPKPGWGASFDEYKNYLLEAGLGGVAEFAGLRANPSTFMSQAFDLADMETQAYLMESGKWKEGDDPIKYTQLTALQKARVRDRNPEIQALLDRHYIDRPGSSDIQERINHVHGERRLIGLEYKQALQDLSEKFLVTETDGSIIRGRAFRERVSDLGRIASLKHEALNDEYADVVDEIKKERDERNENTNLYDLAYQQYIEEVVLGDYERESGEFDYKKFVQADEEFNNTWVDNPEVLQYIESRRTDGMPPMIANLKFSQKIMRPYWNMGETILRRMNMNDLLPIWEQYQNARNIEQADLIARYPVLRQIASAVQKGRRLMREQNESVDAWLYKWEYTDTLAHYNNQALGEEAVERDFVGFPRW